ncbi:MAG: DUF4124 domain-containing protein [Steroidobacteraceae bacterium]
MLIAMPVLAASVWKWRDANGVVHYSDQPVAGAEQVNIQSSTTSLPSPSATASSSSSAVSGQRSSASAVNYQTVEISSPGAEETVANTGGQVSVAVRVEPALAKTHRLALYLDGRAVPGFPEQGMGFTLQEVERGEHTLMLTVLDAQGKPVATSPSIKFYVRQPSVLQPPR